MLIFQAQRKASITVKDDKSLIFFSLKTLSDTDVKDIQHLPGFIDLATELDPLAYQILAEGLRQGGLQLEQYLDDVLKARKKFMQVATHRDVRAQAIEESRSGMLLSKPDSWFDAHSSRQCESAQNTNSERCLS